jgi:hypothetical protein
VSRPGVLALSAGKGGLLAEDGSTLGTAELEKRLAAGMHPVLKEDRAKGK